MFSKNKQLGSRKENGMLFVLYFTEDKLIIVI
jgi:hypothetical protein